MLTAAGAVPTDRGSEVASLSTLRPMASYEYRTEVLTHGFLGRKDEEFDRKEFEERLNKVGGEGWEFDKLIPNMALHGEKDGHLLVFKRELG